MAVERENPPQKRTRRKKMQFGASFDKQYEASLKAPVPEVKPIPATGKKESGDCVHHWMMGSPVNGVVPAVCKHCNTVRDYPEPQEGFSMSKKSPRGEESLE